MFNLVFVLAYFFHKKTQADRILQNKEKTKESGRKNLETKESSQVEERVFVHQPNTCRISNMLCKQITSYLPCEVSE